MRKYRRWMGALAAVGLGANSAWAGGVVNATITKVEVENNGEFFFYLSSNIANGPSCGQVTPNAFAVDGTTAQGRVQVSVILAAYALGKTVNMGGTGTCSVHPSFETLSDFYTSD
jgi:hypothetical protein